MKITSQEIKQHEFERAFRGYNIEEVDIFLNNLAHEWERTSTESRMLRMQLEIAEKEATKLREVEMSLIKTLQTAEDTSTKIAEHARKEAESTLHTAKEEAANEIHAAKTEARKIIEEAETKARNMVLDAENQVTQAQKSIIERERNLKADIAKLETYKEGLIAQLRSLSTATLDKLGDYSTNPNEAGQSVGKKNESKVGAEEAKAIASSANTISLAEGTGNEEEKPEEEALGDDLTLIEGIGPKIAELLHTQHISSFRDLITTPPYKVKDILAAQGTHFAMHDPSTWAQQARLADAGKWGELEEMKNELLGGREVDDPIRVEESGNEGKEVGKATEQQNTEEMLDRVNKVKAALKRAMVGKEKNEASTVSEEKTEGGSSGGSFFDNL